MEGSSMIGLGVLLFLCIWGAIALLIASLIGKKLLKKFTKDAEGRTTSKGVLIILVLSILVFFAPIADEIISYPSYYKMCEDGGKYEFAPGMDAKKASEREVFMSETYDYILLFPHFKTLLTGNVPQQRNVKKDSGVIVERATIRYMDATTKELVLTYKWIDPIASFSAINWNGKEITWLLRRCDSSRTTEGKLSNDFFRNLNLTISDAPINFNTTN
jgi:hypothetical protein